MVFQGYEFSFGWEITLMTWLQARLPATAISIISIFSAFGEELVLIAILAFFYLCWDKEMGRKIGVTIAFSKVANPMLKNIAFRRRPYFDHDGIKCLRAVDSKADLYDIAAQGYSFPSGHSTNAASLYPAIARFGEKNRKGHAICAAVLCILVGFSRVVVGCHYPTDVICGWILGLLILLLTSFLYDKVENHWIITAILGVVGLVGFFYCQTNDYYTSYGMLLGILLSEPFEKKYVNFEPTRKLWKIVLRMAGGMGIYLGLNALLKLPFSKEFLDCGSFLAHFVRSARYFIVIFVDMAVYPKLFHGDKTAA